MRVHATSLVFMGIMFVVGLAGGIMVEDARTQNKCDLAWNSSNNDSDVWIDINNITSCYDKIDCDIMYDREKGYHNYIVIDSMGEYN